MLSGMAKSREEIQHYYKDSEIEMIPLSQQKELKSVKIWSSVRQSVWRRVSVSGRSGNRNRTAGRDIRTADRKPCRIAGGGHAGYHAWTDGDGGAGTRQAGRRAWGIRFLFARWTDRYKEAREYLYGTMGEEPDEEAAHEIMLEEAEQGNAYAMHDMGKIYAQGIGCEADKEKADVWYKKHWRQCIM